MIVSIPGVLIGILGIAGVIAAYPIYNRVRTVAGHDPTVRKEV